MFVLTDFASAVTVFDNFTLLRLGHPYLFQSAYSILSDLLALSMDDPTVNIQSHMSDILKVDLSSPPLRSDAALTAAWAGSRPRVALCN